MHQKKWKRREKKNRIMDRSWIIEDSSIKEDVVNVVSSWKKEKRLRVCGRSEQMSSSIRDRVITLNRYH